MKTSQADELKQITELHEEVLNKTVHYWEVHSGFDTWQFWVLVAFIILPLVALFFLLDRRKALLIGFFGFNVHVWFHYIDLLYVHNGLIAYPYKLIPLLPTSISLDTSFVPVAFMLLYQWTLNHNKNFYLYAAGCSIFFAFLFKPAMVSFGFFRFYEGTNYLHLFAGYVTVLLVSKMITNLFVYFINQKENPEGGSKPQTFHRVPFGIRKKAR